MADLTMTKEGFLKKSSIKNRKLGVFYKEKNNGNENFGVIKKFFEVESEIYVNLFNLELKPIL